MKKAFLFFCTLCAACLTGCFRDAAAIGVIGAADGPTSIFVGTHISWQAIVGIVTLVVLVLGAVFYILKKKKKK
ncbi:MAG: sodium ion-translocating decarboxylase subunit beta [Ruthenibacterium sp.]